MKTCLTRVARAAVILVESLALALTLLFVGEAFDWNWVREASGIM